ncbi:hypothetical protein, partial [Yersinia ruckeri]|uniref:hypothetical protein n=1 Tax=Yersinia ruckeri TaxID=29486 RepID=UPI001C2F4B79
PCKGDALPTELIAPPCCWSRIIGIVRSESTVFKTKTIVRRNFKQDAIFITSADGSLAITTMNNISQIRNGVEELEQSDRMWLTFFKFRAIVGICRQA